MSPRLTAIITTMMTTMDKAKMAIMTIRDLSMHSEAASITRSSVHQQFCCVLNSRGLPSVININKIALQDIRGLRNPKKIITN